MQRRVTVDGTEIVLIGTAHVSPDSVSEVSEVIEREDPDVVAVELDEDRLESLRDEQGWADMDVAAALEEGKGGLLAVNVLLSIYQRKLGDEFDLQPGQEMLTAVEAAEDAGIRTDLIDRDVSDTLRSARDNLSLREKARFLNELVLSLFADEDDLDIEDLTEEDTIETVISELGGSYPGLKRAFIDERDRYMADRLRGIDAGKVVAVVGAGHVDGIAANLEGGGEAPPEPRRGRIPVRQLLKYGVPAVIIGLFAGIFLVKGVAAGTAAFTVWFLLNGAAAALGAILSRAHPGTVVVSFLAAPFTSINPLLPSGLVAAYAENRFDPPTVGDLEAVGTVSSYRAFWENSALNLILVFLLVNLGSSIASYIGGGYLAQVLA